MSPETQVLTMEARRVLHLGQKELGELLHLSRRTIQRWDSGRSGPVASELAKLAAAVYPSDASLAARLARAAGATLVSLGLERPPAPVVAPPAASPPTPPSPPHLVDTVVCAAAEALNTPPPAVRPVLLAAFRRAREVGLRVEDVEKALSEAIEKPAERKSRRR